MISADGSVVAFSSQASDLVANDENLRDDVFAYSLTDDSITLISVNSDGTGTGNSRSFNPVISADGSVVAFESRASDLVFDFNDENGTFVSDVFAYSLTDDSIRLISVNSDGTGTGNRGSFSPVINADGSVVAFESRASDLVADDENGTNDIFAYSLTDLSLIHI